MSFRAVSLVALPVVTIYISSCAYVPPVPPGPPTGWVNIDPITSQGTYLRSDGSRWVGGQRNGNFHGTGTFFYPTSEYGTSAIPRGYEGAAMTREARDNQWVAGPIEVVVPGSGDDYGFKFKGLTDGKGFKGPGVLRLTTGLQAGLQIEGEFDHQDMPINRIVSGGYHEWNNFSMIGSYAHGMVRASWPDGSTFEGIIVDFYPFMRSSPEVVCIQSYFYGNGLLKRPGKPDYVGLVGQSWTLGPVSKQDFIKHVENFGDCVGKALAKQSEINNRQAAYDAEMEDGRQRANAILAADMSSLSRRVANDVARVESASRGSSLEIDQENERKSARLREIRSERQEEERSVPQLESETKQTKGAGATVGAVPPNVTQPLAKVDRKTFPFSKTVTYESTYANLSKEKALETVKSERARLEPTYTANASRIQIANESAPECSIRDDIRETGHWRCKITVQYKGESYLNPDATDATGNVQSR